MYFAKVCVRPFDPYAALEVHCPVRSQSWRLCSQFFDYRSAQDSGALVPRDGLWYARKEERLDGDLVLEYPRLGNIPTQIDCHVRLSWWPPHVTVTWMGAGVYQKVSFRPIAGAPCEWTQIPFEADLFTDDIRGMYPEIFDRANVPDRPCPVRPSTTPVSSVTVHEPKVTETPAVTTAKEVKAIPKFTGPEPKISDPEPNPAPDDEDRWSQQSEDTDEWSQSGGWRSYNDWYENDDNNEWNDNSWENNHWGTRNDDGHGQSDSWWSRPCTWTPADRDPEPWGETELPKTSDVTSPSPSTDPNPVSAMVNEEPPMGTTSSVTEDSDPSTLPQESITELPIQPKSPPPPFPGGVQVTQTETTVRTRSISSPISVTAPGQSSFESLLKLQNMAIRGAPLSREERLYRQSLASSLSLDPQVYNYLCFGEQEDQASYEPYAVTNDADASKTITDGSQPSSSP